MKPTLRKKISAGVAVLIAAQLIAVACYVSSSRTCPGHANRGTVTCTLDIGSSYSWVATDNSGATGNTGAKSDDTNHCHYSNGSTGFWAFPGASLIGSCCGNCGDGDGDGDGGGG